MGAMLSEVDCCVSLESDIPRIRCAAARHEGGPPTFPEAHVIVRSSKLSMASMTMAIQVDHIIVRAKNREESARFLSEILGLPEPYIFEPFMCVKVGTLNLDYLVPADKNFPPQHIAFLISEEEFDQIFARVKKRGLTYWADPYGEQPGKINLADNGRAIYFKDPNGHSLEIITQPYARDSANTRGVYDAQGKMIKREYK
jgi:catechol 2,3-dioxygenase-like lactoylglutathione lyase family enzyme